MKRKGWNMTSTIGLTAMSRLNLFRQLYISIIHLLITFKNGESFLTEKPQDAVRAVGQSVTFTCNSSWTDPVRWWFLCEDCSNKSFEELGTNAVERLTLSSMTIVEERGEGSPDGYRSALTIGDVTKWHAGTFRCLDGTGSRGSARLTVTSTPKAVCLPVSPRDHVVLVGDSVVFTASGPSTRLRYYYHSLGARPEQRVLLYNGEIFNDSAIDERYSMVGTGDQGHADLVIRSVQTKDAGQYIVKDVRRMSFEVAVKLVVLYRFPECTIIRHLSNDHEIQLQCHAEYTGLLTPRVSFLRRDVTEQSLQKTVNGGIIRFLGSVKISDLESSSSDTTASPHFEIGFELSQCGEPAGTWTWKYVIPELPMGEVPLYSKWCQLSSDPLVTTIGLVLSVTINMVFFAIVVVQRHRVRRGSRVDNSKVKSSDVEYGRLDSKSSSSSVYGEEIKERIENC